MTAMLATAFVMAIADQIWVRTQGSKARQV
jgi:hypothetical protein